MEENFFVIRNGEKVKLEGQELKTFKESLIPLQEFEPIPAKTKIYKSTFIRRMSASEAAIMYDILEGEEPWMKLLYNATDFFLINDALVGYLHMVLTSEFGEERANDLLELEE